MELVHGPMHMQFYVSIRKKQNGGNKIFLLTWPIVIEEKKFKKYV